MYKDTATGELYTFERKTDKVAHYLTVDGKRIEITDVDIANRVFTDEDGAFLKKVENIDPTCDDSASRCRYFVCECCGELYTVLYKQAHQKSEEPVSPRPARKTLYGTATGAAKTGRRKAPLSATIMCS